MTFDEDVRSRQLRFERLVFNIKVKEEISHLLIALICMTGLPESTVVSKSWAFTARLNVELQV